MASSNTRFKTTNRVRLTAKRVHDFSCLPEKTESFLWDDEVTGFAVKANRGGSKNYLFQGRYAGKTIKKTIGDIKDWELSPAREEAKRLSVLCDQGIDPRQEKQEKIEAAQQQQRQVIRERLTFGEVWSAYIEANKARWRVRYLRDHINFSARGGQLTPLKSTKRVTIDKPIAALLDIRLKDLSETKLKIWLEKENLTRPTNTATCYRMVRACLNWAQEQDEFSGLLPNKSYNSKKVKKLVQAVRSKGDCLQKEQLQPLFNEILKMGNPIVAAYLQVTLLTGARRNEIENLKWSDVDFKWKVMQLRDKVEESGRPVPLTPYMEQLLFDLPRIENNDFVFASNESESGYITDPLTPLQLAAQRAALPHITIHGLRRSFESLSEWIEMPTGIVSQISGHKPSGTVEKHYKIRPIDLLRKWHIKYEEWILTEAGFIQNHENLYRHAGVLKVV